MKIVKYTFLLVSLLGALSCSNSPPKIPGGTVALNFSYTGDYPVDADHLMLLRAYNSDGQQVGQVIVKVVSDLYFIETKVSPLYFAAYLDHNANGLVGDSGTPYTFFDNQNGINEEFAIKVVNGEEVAVNFNFSDNYTL